MPETRPNGPISRILDELSAAAGLSFASLKPATLHEGLAQQMRFAGFRDSDDYLEWLRERPQKMREAAVDLLNRTTRFFRDPGEYEALDRHVLRPLVRSRRGDGPIRIWVAGCATGEEAYSIGMLLLERLAEEDLVPPCRIFATDVNPAVLARARAGIYPARALAGLSRDRLDRFFLPRNGDYRVVDPLRNLCVFSRRDVSRQLPFSRLDLVSCRNVMLYFTPEARRDVLDRFWRALKPGGFLHVGRGEPLSLPPGRFQRVNRHGIYRKREGPAD